MNRKRSDRNSIRKEKKNKWCVCSTDVLGYGQDEWWWMGSVTLISFGSFGSVVLLRIFSNHSQLEKRKVCFQSVAVIDLSASLVWPFHRASTFSLCSLLYDLWYYVSRILRVTFILKIKLYPNETAPNGPMKVWSCKLDP